MAKGFQTHDGKISGNRQIVEAYDKSHGKAPASDAKKADRGMNRETEGMGGHDEIKSIVAEHGPAHTHIHTKDPKTGRHHSETHHESGHVQHADHDSMEDAQAHGAAAMGEGMDDENPMEADEIHAGEDDELGGEGGFMDGES